MRPTPTRRSPRRSSSSPQPRQKKSNDPPSARRSIKRGLEDSLGSPNLAATPVTKSQKSERVQSPSASDKMNNNSSAGNRSNSSSGGKSKRAYGRRAKMSPRMHGAAIANSLASPFVDTAFLMSSTAPVTPSKRSTAESALHFLAKRGRNGTTQIDDDKKNNAAVKKKQKKRSAINAKNTIDSQPQNDAEFVPKGKVEERWLKNFNKWKHSMEQGLDETTQNSPMPKSWISAQRREYKAMKQKEKTTMTQSKVDLLESAGFTWDAPIGRPKRNNSSNNNDAAAATATHTDVKTNASKRRKKSNGESVKKLSPSKRTSPRKSCPTQFYHNLLGSEEKNDNDETDNSNKDGPKTNKSISNVKEGYKCGKCGEPKKGHICTKDKSDDDEKAVKSLILLSTSSDEKDQPKKEKRDKKKRRSRGGRQGVSLLSSLEALQASEEPSKKKSVSSGKKEEPAKTKHVEEMDTTSKKAKSDTDATKEQEKKTDSRRAEVKKATPPAETIANEAPTTGDQPISPFPSSPLRTSNLECPESGSISVGQAQNSPAKKNVPESICIRELMMSCLTEEDKEEAKQRNAESEMSQLDPTEQGDDNDAVGEGTKTADDPLPQTPIHHKETPLSTFSPLSMTSPLRANNLLETSYSEEPEIEDKSPTLENRIDSPPNQPVDRRPLDTSRRPNEVVQNEPRNISVAVSKEIATRTSEREDEAKQLELLQAERRYQEKMTDYGKLELEAKLVAERMRQIEERMRQIESSSIANDLREYDEMKRRASYPAEPRRLWKREMIESERNYGSSADDFSDDYDSQRNWRYSAHGRHGDRAERSIKRRKIRSDSRRSNSTTRSQQKKTSQSKRSNTQRRRIEDSMTEDDHDRMSASRKQRKKSSKKRARESGRHSISQMDKPSLKSPYATLQNDEERLHDTRHNDGSPQATIEMERDAHDTAVERHTITAESNAKAEENVTATAPASTADDKPREENKKDSDSTSSSTKQSSIEDVGKSNVQTQHISQKKDAQDPLYWLAGGESDSDEESWDFDGPMILPPPPA